MVTLNAKSTEVERTFRLVLISQSATTLQRLERISTAAVVEEVIRTGGRNFSLDELTAMGDDLDFDAMAAAARKREMLLARARTAKSRSKTKLDA